MNLPLISFVITSYNQKDYIIKAVKSALEQTYSPLEIIVADDHSTDGSDLLVEGLIEEYCRDGGVHKVVFHRNDTNLGVLRNCEIAFSMAHGELIVLGGGDDISNPVRVETIVRNWLDLNKLPTLVFHGVNMVNLDGVPLKREFWSPSVRNPLGAAMAFSPVVVKKFLLSVDTGGYEDNVFARRAYAYGEPMYLKEKLVDYRIGAGSTSAGDTLACRRRISFAMEHSARQNLIDIEYAKGDIDKDRYVEIKTMMYDCVEQYESEYEMLTASTLRGRFHALKKHVRHPKAFVKLSVRSSIEYYLPILFPVFQKPISIVFTFVRWLRTHM